DADREKRAATGPYGVCDTAGQDCCARSRILVQRSVYDRFLELLEPAVKGVRGEDPSLETADMGPLVSRGRWGARPRRWRRRTGGRGSAGASGSGWPPTSRTTPRWPSAARRPTGRDS